MNAAVQTIFANGVNVNNDTKKRMALLIYHEYNRGECKSPVRAQFQLFTGGVLRTHSNHQPTTTLQSLNQRS
jgi:hypothetical protein